MAAPDSTDSSRCGAGAAVGVVKGVIVPTHSASDRRDDCSRLFEQFNTLVDCTQKRHAREDAFCSGVQQLHALTIEVSSACKQLSGIATKVAAKYLCCCKLGFPCANTALRHHNGDGKKREPVHACLWNPSSHCPWSGTPTGTESRNAMYYSQLRPYGRGGGLGGEA